MKEEKKTGDEQKMIDDALRSGNSSRKLSRAWTISTWLIFPTYQLAQLSEKRRHP